MITSVTKQPKDTFLINEAVQISNLNMLEDNVTYDLSYDEELLTEQEAIEIAQEFILEAIENAVKG